MGLDELQQKDYLRKLFNTKFKSQNQLDNLIEYMYKKNIQLIRIGFSKGHKFFTSDNPMINLIFQIL